MKLSNTMIMNEALLPKTKKAFTLAEVLITLSILGVVAALTIPSLVNRQNEMAAITKMKKAISTYESVVEVYMAENEATRFDVLSNVGEEENTACQIISQYFKTTQTVGGYNGGNGGALCTFKTADGVVWKIDGNGYAVVIDSLNPRYGVVMWAEGGVVNGTQTEGINGPTTPVATPGIIEPNGPADLVEDVQSEPNHGYFSAAQMLNISGSRNQEAADAQVPTIESVIQAAQ